MSLFCYQLTISYKGTSYLGWQIQKQQGKTIQGEIKKALKKISKSDDIKVIGSGRTDAGVHALAQVAKVEIKLEIDSNSLMHALNSHLSLDIRILKAQKCSRDFHPIADSIWKEYIYVFSMDRQISPFMIDGMASYSYELDVELMKEAASLFVGKHDFSNFFCTGSTVKTTIREIFECELTHHKAGVFFNNYCRDFYIFRVRGEGFLKQMVRLMVGSLWHIGRGKADLQTLKKALRGNHKGKLGPVAPPNGLYLKQVHYY